MNANAEKAHVVTDRARLVREKARLLADGAAACSPLANRYAQAQHDVELAREALERAERIARAAQADWNNRSLAMERGRSALEAELVATAPIEIDAALADIEALKRQYRFIIAPVEMAQMSDGSRAPTAESLADNRHNSARWQSFLDAEKELLAMKLEALSPPELNKRIEGIKTRVQGMLYFDANSAAA